MTPAGFVFVGFIAGTIRERKGMNKKKKSKREQNR